MFMNTAFDNVCFKGSVVSQSAKFVYLCLCKHADNNHQTCFPSLRRIAEIVGRSISTIKRAVRELLKFGAIERSPRFRKDGGQTSNLYKIKECNFDEIINDFQDINQNQINRQDAITDDISSSITTEIEPTPTCMAEGKENIIEHETFPALFDGTTNTNSSEEKLSDEFIQENSFKSFVMLDQKNSLSRRTYKFIYKTGFMQLIKRLYTKFDTNKSKDVVENELGGGHGRPSRNLSN